MNNRLKPLIWIPLLAVHFATASPDSIAVKYQQILAADIDAKLMVDSLIGF